MDEFVANHKRKMNNRSICSEIITAMEAIDSFLDSAPEIFIFDKNPVPRDFCPHKRYTFRWSILRRWDVSGAMYMLLKKYWLIGRKASDFKPAPTISYEFDGQTKTWTPFFEVIVKDSKALVDLVANDQRQSDGEIFAKVYAAQSLGYCVELSYFKPDWTYSREECVELLAIFIYTAEGKLMFPDLVEKYDLSCYLS